MFDEKAFKNFMISEGILTEEEYNFINQYTKETLEKMKDYSKQDYGCFPLSKDSSIESFRVLVPPIVDLKSMRVNIHEYTHAKLIYEHIYNGVELDETEIKPILNEVKYLNKIKQKSKK